MMRFVYVFLLTGVCCIPEILLRGIGLLFPLCALLVFYITAALGTGWGILCAVLGSCALDFPGAGASHPWSLIAFIPVMLLSRSWVRKIKLDTLSVNLFPGLMIPLIVWIVSVLFYPFDIMNAVMETFPGLIPASVLSAILLPLMIYLLDNLNKKIGLPLYENANEGNKNE